ncbi:hypothetical protein AWH69_04690 [Janibacter melonis]|uniref:Sigma-70 family RNA polymerase sigma factor n=1 Tax=Janibacter melonis TaxID=262209 RepID=A0A176QCI3_9MICO|nr:RNA polymerase sigma factor [Janibacter melonis]OAB87393.1 hypothetical protein AWH69_04690 [Janibacter melonis]
MTASSSPPLALGADPLAAVFERHYAEVYRYLARRVPRAVAEDLASETFVQAAARPGGFDPERGSARAWVFGIATHLLSRHHRDEVRAYRAWARTGVDPVAAGDGAEQVDARVDAGRRASALPSALAAMADGDRDVLLLVALTYPEAAQALDIPVGTVRSRLHRARRDLRTALSTDDPKGED